MLFTCAPKLYMKTLSVSLFPVLLVAALFTGILFADTQSQAPASQAKKKKRKKSKAKPVAAAHAAKPAPDAAQPMTGKVVAHSTSRHFVGTVTPSSSRVRPMARRRKAARGPWDEPTYADST